MLSLLLIITFIVTILFFVIVFKTRSAKNEVIIAFSIFGVIGSFATLLLIAIWICCIDSVLTNQYIDEKITMYQEENAKIEEQIDTLVKNYMQYEYDTYTELKTIGEGNSITLVSLYPDLKSDELVQQQLSLYMGNVAEIKNLKQQKFEVIKNRWWLYFGGLENE